MIVVGINMPSTSEGMKLNDGGCALIKDNQIYAVAEERVSRKKHAEGYQRSLEYCLQAASVSLEEVDLFVASSCCEKALSSSDIHIQGVPQEKILVCPSHHLSHALGAFCLSGMEEALVMVIDNEGNILEEDELYDQPFHKRKMEHMSYYHGKVDDISLLETDDVDCDRVGVGDAYRYFTHYLGFPSYVYAGKTMGLASYGEKDSYEDKKIFRLNNGHIVCDIENQYFDCIGSLKRFLKKNGINTPPRMPLDNLTKEHARLARWIQRETEDILVEKVQYLVEKTGLRNLCIAGGVGLNSVANAEILKRSGIEQIFILPAAGDSGQCVGNALYGIWQVTKKLPHISFNTAYLGMEYSLEQIDRAVDLIKNDENYEVNFFDSMEAMAQKEAELIWSGQYVGHFDGRSEFGPRALGNRSILANPCSKTAKDDLNQKIKYRESFRPFAPIVLSEKADQYFDIDREVPFMLLVAPVKEKVLLPAVTHVDGTARLQTVSEDQNPKICALLRQFEKISGVPVLLNTSFNIAGEPIAETPYDAVECFTKTALNVLSIGNYIIIKKKCETVADDYTAFVTSLGANL